MLPRRNRLSPDEAKRLKEKASSRFFSLYFRKTKEREPRFMVVVGSKVFPLATKRNKLKRKMRECLRILGSPGIQGVLVALPAARGLNNKKVKEEILELFKKI